MSVRYGRTKTECEIMLSIANSYLDAKMINGKILEWVIPLLLLFCVFFEMLDKIIIVTIICLFISIRINHNQFGNQVV